MENTVQISGIGQVALTVSDLAAARHFYQQTLGMEHLFDAGTMAFFRCGEVRLMIGAGDRTDGHGGTLLYFRVTDMQAAHAALKQRGVQFVQEPHVAARMKSHDLWLAFVKDPSGNTLGLMSEAARE